MSCQCRHGVTPSQVLVHSLLVLFTGGLWLIPLVVRKLLK